MCTSSSTDGFKMGARVPEIEPRTRLLFVDQLAEAATSLLEHPARTLMSMALVATSAALISIVTTLGASASRQVSDRFDALRATTVQIRSSSLPVATIAATALAGGLAGTLPGWAAARVDPAATLSTG